LRTRSWVGEGEGILWAVSVSRTSRPPFLEILMAVWVEGRGAIVDEYLVEMEDWT
jgi:hypothetical protein